MCLNGPHKQNVSFPCMHVRSNCECDSGRGEGGGGGGGGHFYNTTLANPSLKFSTSSSNILTL